ncbi:MAG: hypothetical protein NVS1B11_04110 [Terriglobales bacterium]
MRINVVMVMILLSGLAQAREAKTYSSGTLLQMDSVECGVDEKSGNTLAGEIIGTDGAHKKTHALLCQEYLLQTDRVLYRIRPRDEKHPVLLPVGEKAQFRMTKDKIVLRVEDLDDKERDYTVVSMTPRQSNGGTEQASK